MAKIYHFPQGKEKNKIKKQIKKIKGASVVKRRKETALSALKKIFFFIRVFIGVSCDVIIRVSFLLVAYKRLCWV